MVRIGWGLSRLLPANWERKRRRGEQVVYDVNDDSSQITIHQHQKELDRVHTGAENFITEKNGGRKREVSHSRTNCR